MSKTLFALPLLLLACGPAGDSNLSEDPSETGEVRCEPGIQAPCYEGEDATLNVGPCHAGVATCNEDGNGWSTCSGQVLPVFEICENNVDDDCNGFVDDIVDIDGDGFDRCSGDCCETTTECAEPALVNPGAVEVIAEDGSASADENCDGNIDEAKAACDQSIPIDDFDPRNAARAIDICGDGLNGAAGVVNGAYTRANGAPIPDTIQHGIHTQFGSNVSTQFGSSMLVLSTGPARTANQPGACNGQSCSFHSAGVAPPGFPQDVPECPGSTDIRDDISLQLELRAPTNATGYSFDFKFYTFEYPEWVCNRFNDQFVVIADPAPPGSINGNIAFDSQTNPVSVNIAFFDVCDGCPAGTAEMEGTGFNDWNDAGATQWLRTTAPVEGGTKFTLDFSIWDTGDNNFDSTVLIDNFQWLAEPVEVNTNPID